MAWGKALYIVQITLGGVMCLLIAIQFVRTSLQMYKATKRFQLNRYVNLLVREGMLYFLAYVHVLSYLTAELTGHCYK